MLVMSDSKFAERAEVRSTQILFIGSQFVFPDLILRLVSNEFDGVGVVRQERLDLGAEAGAAGDLRLVILEDAFARDIEQRLEEIRAHFAGVPIVLAYRDKRVARRLLTLQQSDDRLEGLRFLPINAPIRGLVSMLQILLSGDFVVPGELLASPGAQREAAVPGGPAPAPVAAAKAVLTQRELQVLDLVAKGRRNKAIAGELGLSEHTVKLHIHHIITKVKVGNRTEAANWYLARIHADGPPRSGR